MFTQTKETSDNGQAATELASKKQSLTCLVGQCLAGQCLHNVLLGTVGCNRMKLPHSYFVASTKPMMSKASLRGLYHLRSLAGMCKHRPSTSAADCADSSLP